MKRPHRFHRLLPFLLAAATADAVWCQTEQEPDFRLPRSITGLRVQRLELPSRLPEELAVVVTLGDVAHELELARAPVRAAGFTLLVDSPSGLAPAEPPPAATYRGTLDYDPGSRVVASLIGGELEATILLPDGTLWEVVPAARLGKQRAPGLHATFARPGLLPGGGTQAFEQLEIAQLGVDSEWRHTRWAGGVTSTVQRIEAEVNSANLRYESQLGVRFELSTLVVRTSSGADPYAAFEQGGNCNALVQLSGDVWEDEQLEEPWDLVVLYHLKPLTGGASSCASIGSLCTCGSGYTVISGVGVDNGFPYGFLHEVGHVFGAHHDACEDPGCTDCFIMGNCGAGGTNTYYCDCEIAEMQPLVDAAPCLSASVADEPPSLDQPGDPSVMAPTNHLPVTLHGQNLSGAQYVAFDDGSGTQTFRCKTIDVNDETLLVKSPLPAAFGEFQLAVGNSVGRTGWITLEYVPTSPPFLSAPATIKTGPSLFTRKLYGPPDAHVRHLRANGNGATSNQQGFQVLTQQDAVHTHVLNALGQATQGGLVGNQPGAGGHVYCQFVVYTDATYTTIVSVSNVTDTLVTP